MLSLFFVDNLNGKDSQVLLGDEANHAIKVLRLEIGEEIKISDGTGTWVSGPIIEKNKKTLGIQITSRGVESEQKPEIVLVQAVTKSDRNKEMLELITVAGVDRIIPWQSDRSISKWQIDSDKKWRITIKEACKQSRRVRIPKLDGVVSAKQFVTQVNSDDLILVLHEEAKIKFSNISIPSAVSVVYLIIGPEGGISSEELNIFKSANANIVKLGEPVLRSAHAGIAALAAIQTKLGRW